MKNTTINITVPVFNRFYLTQKTILNLRKLDSSIAFFINVVDNGSSKELRNILIKFANDKIIDNLFLINKNMGVACAANIGWNCIDADFFIKIDNDIIIKDFKFIDHIFDMMCYVESNSAFGPALLKKMINNSELIEETPYGKLALCKNSLPGGALIIPKSISDVIGKFNEEYGLYGAEDGDYGARVALAGFKQYFYEYEKFFSHEGKWDSSEYKDYGLDKKKEYDKLFRVDNNGVGLFPLNLWLYQFCIRSWKVPQRFEICEKNGYNIKVKEKSSYKDIQKALLISKKALEYNTVRKQGKYMIKSHKTIGTVINKLKNIWKNCGQECTLENLL